MIAAPQKTKRPGQCVNTAEPRSTAKILEETPMNTNINNTQTAETATKRIPQIKIELERLAALDPESAYGLRSVIDTLNDVISGLMCQPRFWNDEGTNYNDAGLLLTDVAEFTMSLHDRLVEAVEDRKPEGIDETKWRFWTILQCRAGFADFAEEMIPDIAVIAATAARDISEANRETRRQALQDARGKA